MQPNTIDTDRFMDTMTEESYALAQSLGIPLTDIPCLVFVETHNVSVYHVLKLNSVGEDSLIQILRRFVTDYLNKPSNKEYFQTLERIKRLEEDRTSQIAKLRRIPQDIERANTRIQQLRLQLDSERERITQSVRKQLLDDFVSPEKARLVEVRTMVGPLRGLLAASEKDARNILFKWVREGRADPIRTIALDKYLSQLLQYLSDLGSGEIEREIIKLTTAVKRRDLEHEEQKELGIRLNALRSAREEVRIKFLQLVNQDMFFDRNKIQEHFQSLQVEERTLLSVVFDQIYATYPARLETEVDNALTVIRDPIESEIAILEERLRQLTAGDLEIAINNAIAPLSEEIRKLNELIRTSHPDAFGVLANLNRRYSIKQVKLSAGTAFREYGPTIIDFLSRIFAG